jgi:isopentenyl-diphosphate Delta-isomerase
MDEIYDISRRKLDHIELCLSSDVSMTKPTGFNRLFFMHQALPEIALEDVSLETSFLGHPVSAPIFISSMTGGPARGEEINRHLGEAAKALKLPMGVGSQRIIFENKDARRTFEAARKAGPDVPLFANLGAVQFNYGFGIDEVLEAVSSIEANGIFLHLNALQEVVQPGGNTNFRNLLGQIGEVAAKVDFPVIVKEVGCGISPNVATVLAAKGVSAIDVSGAGGTSWAKIESHRTSDYAKRTLGEVFGNWGIPTAESLVLCRDALPDFPLIASGGIRTGLEVAKAIALGADMVSFAMPLLEPATKSSEDVIAALEQIMAELRVAMFLIGVRDIPSLKASRYLLKEVR